jgi:hypothetical protein
MLTKKFIKYLFLIPVLYSSALFAQSPGPTFNLKQMLPTSPEAAALGKFGEIPVGTYTGTADISIPLYTIKEAGVEIPINLSYHSSGIKVDEDATNVGLGWNLEPGGSIIQIVNGQNVEPDPINYIDHAGYLYTLSQGQQSFYFERDPIGMFGYNCYTSNVGDLGDSQAILNALSQGFGQPDIFQYNFGGFSGKFYINPQTAQPVLLDKKSNLTFVFSPLSITATTMDGNIFTFDAIETSGADVFLNYTGKTFKLSKIQLHTGKIISFTYLDGYYHSAFYNETFRTDYPANKSDGYTNKVEPHSDYAEHYTKMLSSITTDKVIVNFNMEDRIDLNTANPGTRLPAKRIKSVDITDSLSGQKIKSYNFAYSYFTSPTPASGLSYLAPPPSGTPPIAASAINRLKLLSVQEVGYDQSQQPVLNPPYTFAYNERLTMPDKGNYSRDYWGFYNGVLNSKLMPDLSFFYFSDDQDYQSMPATVVANINGANRAPDSSKMKALVLEKITYPTGGFSEFDYEPHIFSNHIYPDVERVATASRSALLNDHNMAGDLRTTTFTLPAAQTIAFHISITKGNNSALSFYDLEPSTITFSKTVGGTNTVIKTWQMLVTDKAEFDGNGGNFVRDESINIPYTAGATYTVSCDMADAIGQQTTGMALVSSHFNYYQPTTYTNSYGGGLRVAAVRNYSAASVLATKKTYKYLNANGTSSGVMMSPYKPLNSRIMYGVILNPGPIPQAIGSNILTWFGSSESLVPYSDAAGGNIVGYTRIEEAETAGDGSVNGKHVSFYNNVASNAHPNVPDDPNLLNGMISRDEIYSNASSTTPLTATDYSYNSLGFSYYAGIKSMSSFVGDEPSGCPNAYAPDNGFWSQVKKWRLYFYPLHSEWYMLTNKTTTENFGSQALTTSHTYTYNAIGQMASDAMTNSKGQTLKTNYTYPYDIPAGSRTTAQQALVDKSLYNSIIQQTNFNNTTVTSEDYVTYNFTPNNQLAKSKIEHEVGQQGLYTEYTFDDYGPYKTLKQVSEKGLKPSALLWNDNKAYIIAEAANATSPDVAYTSFEPNQSGKWTIPVSTRNTGGITGAKCYPLGSNAISDAGLTSATTYVVSYWTQNTVANTVMGTIPGYPIKGQTINGWTYYEHHVTGITTATISGTGNIDELRLYPIGAQMTTYTYDQMQGITSITDVKNQASYFEYDSFRRLMNVKDKDGNIVKHSDYHYQGQ